MDEKTAQHIQAANKIVAEIGENYPNPMEQIEMVCQIKNLIRESMVTQKEKHIEQTDIYNKCLEELK